MDNNNWRPSQGESNMDLSDWRNQLQPDSRQRLVNKFMATLKRHLPLSSPEELQELKKIAVRFEEKIYTGATSQSDYSKKMSLKMLTMETESQNTGFSNPILSNVVGTNQNPSDPASLDSTAQGGHPTVVDSLEETYQKLKNMKELYLPELSEMYQKILIKCQQHDSLQLPQKTEQFEKIKMFKTMLERLVCILQMPKIYIGPGFKEKLPGYENQIVNILASNRPKKPISSQQQGQQQLISSCGHPLSMQQQQQQLQQAQSQIPRLQQHDNQLNSHLQNSASSMQPNAAAGIHGSIPTMGVSIVQTNIMSSMQPGSNLESGQGNGLSSLQQGAGGRSLQQNNPSMPQQANISTLSQSGINSLLSNVNPLQQNPNVYPHQPLKSGALFPISSPQLLPAASPQISQHSSPQIDQQTLLSSLSKAATPLQSAHSPFIVSSPCTPLAPSPIPGDHEKQTSAIFSLSNVGNIGHPQPAVALAPAQSLAIGTPGMSASPLLAKLTTPDGNQVTASTIISSKSSVTEQPLERLIKVANHALLEEIRGINRRLIDTVVDISDEDVDPTAAEGGDGTIVKCSFGAVALSPNLKSQYDSAQMSPILPLRLLVPTNYPSCSPILLDKIPVELSKESEDFSVRAKSRFSISLRSLSQPMSLGDLARTWDVCARAVVAEYAQQSGGGTFSSRYGTWETCIDT